MMKCRRWRNMLVNVASFVFMLCQLAHSGVAIAQGPPQVAVVFDDLAAKDGILSEVVLAMVAAQGGLIVDAKRTKAVRSIASPDTALEAKTAETMRVELDIARVLVFSVVALREGHVALYMLAADRGGLHHEEFVRVSSDDVNSRVVQFIVALGPPAQLAGAKIVETTKVQQQPLHEEKVHEPALVSNSQLAEPIARNTPNDTVATSGERVDDRIDVQMPAGGAGVSIRQLHKTEENRQTWLERGGDITSTEGKAGLTFMNISNDIFDMTMYGVNLGIAWVSLGLTPPNFDEDITSWSASRVGLGLGGNITKGSTTISIGDSETSFEMTSVQLRIDGIFGYQWGLGSFLLDSEWSGWVIGLDWRPSLGTTITDGEASGYYSLAGFGISLSSTTLTTAIAQYAQEAHYSFDFMLLPPIGDMPLIVSLSIGFLTY